MQVPITGRIFLVGCPRSGTTLLQSLLTAHPQVASFPESHFFRALIANRGPWRRKLGLASRKARSRFNEFLCEIDHDEIQQYLPRFAWSIDQYAQAFVWVLDTLTEQQGKNLWLEKTPGHLHNIKYIERLVVGAKFIHMVRSGADTVASLYEVTHKYPHVWHGPRDIDQCIRRWIEDVRISHSHLHKANHTLVRYEQLVEDPRSVLIELCTFLGITYNKTMLQGYSVAAEQVVLRWELWKHIGETIRTANSKKFYKLFSEEQKRYILNRLSEVNLDELSVKPQQKYPISRNIQ